MRVLPKRLRLRPPQPSNGLAVDPKKQPPVAESTGGHRQHHRIDDVDIAGAAGWQSKPSANRQKKIGVARA
jgi:hypothetical protein